MLGSVGTWYHSCWLFHTFPIFVYHRCLKHLKTVWYIWMWSGPKEYIMLVCWPPPFSHTFSNGNTRVIVWYIKLHYSDRLIFLFFGIPLKLRHFSKPRTLSLWRGASAHQSHSTGLPGLGKQEILISKSLLSSTTAKLSPAKGRVTHMNGFPLIPFGRCVVATTLWPWLASVHSVVKKDL